MVEEGEEGGEGVQLEHGGQQERGQVTKRARHEIKRGHIFVKSKP